MTAHLFPIPGLPLDSVAAWLMSYLLHSALLLGSVWIVTRFRLLSPGFQDVLWKTALVGGLLTATIQTTGLGGEPLGGLWTVQATTPEAAGSSTTAVRHPEASDLFLDPGSAPASRGTLAGVWERVSTAAAQGWPQLVTAVWVLGAALCLARLGGARARLFRRLGERREITEGPLRSLLDSLCRVSGIRRRVRLTVSEGIAGPVALGRSEICLPTRAVTDLDREQQTSVLAHELAHLLRSDPAWRWVTASLEAVFFFQPLNRMARRRLHDCAEFLCDDWAVRRTGESLTLAKCLVEVAGWLQPFPRPASTPSMAERGSTLVQRVQRLLNGPQRAEVPRSRVLPAALLLLGAVAVASPGFTPHRSDVLSQAAPLDLAWEVGSGWVENEVPLPPEGPAPLPPTSSDSRPRPERRIEERSVPRVVLREPDGTTLEVRPRRLIRGETGAGRTTLRHRVILVPDPVVLRREPVTVRELWHSRRAELRVLEGLEALAGLKALERRVLERAEILTEGEALTEAEILTRAEILTQAEILASEALRGSLDDLRSRVLPDLHRHLEELHRGFPDEWQERMARERQALQRIEEALREMIRGRGESAPPTVRLTWI